MDSDSYFSLPVIVNVIFFSSVTKKSPCNCTIATFIVEYIYRSNIVIVAWI
jgi:hypothetical protein